VNRTVNILRCIALTLAYVLLGSWALRVGIMVARGGAQVLGGPVFDYLPLNTRSNLRIFWVIYPLVLVAFIALGHFLGRFTKRRPLREPSNQHA